MASAERGGVTVAQLDVTLDRPVPQSPDAERAVLGAILEHPKCIYRLTNVTEEFFFKDAHRLIWRAIALLIEEGIEIDLLTVKHELHRVGMLEQAGGSAYVSSLVDVVPDVANVERYAAILERAAKGRAVLVAANAAMRAVLDNDEPEDVISALFSSIGDQATPQKMQARTIAEVVSDVSEKMTTLASENKPLGLNTDWPHLNSLHVFRPILAMWCCHSKVGKTALAVSLSDSLARHGHPTVFVSLESDGDEIGLRHMSFSTGIQHGLTQDWRLLKPEQHESIRQYRKDIGDRKMFFVESVRYVEDIVMELRRLKAMHGLKAAFIDYAQNVRTRRRAERQEEKLHEVAQLLQDTAKDERIHISLMSQVKRDAGKNARFAIDDISYAASMGKTARMVFFIDRPFLSDEGSDRDPRHMDVMVVANNEGVRGDFIAQFDEVTQKLWEGKCQVRKNIAPCGHPDCSREQADVAKQNRLY